MVKNKPNVLIYGDSNTWGYVPSITPYIGDDNKTKRYKDKNIYYNYLRKDFNLIVNGLNGRCINNDHPLYSGRNSLLTIDKDLECINNLDIVMIMLGTNDFKDIYKLSNEDILNNLDKLVQVFINKYHPIVVLVAPPRIIEAKISDEKYTDGLNRTIDYSKKLEEYCNKKGYVFVNSSDIDIGCDGMHLTKKGHKKLGKKLKKKLEESKYGME